jgi:hypothetical protein
VNPFDLATITRHPTCYCGSGEHAAAIYDRRGIFCCYACPKCEQANLAMYRPAIFDDANYSHGEPIDED